MGLYEQDDPALYKNSVTSIPPDKTPLKGVGQNIGKVQVRCFINAYCPFVKSPKEDYFIVFNSQTVSDINSLFSNYFDSLVSPGTPSSYVMVEPGTEGIHFIPRYVYRHNYLFLGKDVEISGGRGEISGTDETRYKDEQSWIVEDNVFSDYFNKSVIEMAATNDYFKSLCNNDIMWGYNAFGVNSNYTYDDESLDYKLDYFNKNSKSVNKDNSGIPTNRILVPSMFSASNCLGEGAHWRITKKTPLFRGEDFFVEFYKLAKSPSLNKDEKKQVPFGLKEYLPLDITYKATTTESSLPPATETFPCSQAVSGDMSNFNLFDQSYYVLELGHNQRGGYYSGDKTGENYFIIICERSYPVFIQIDYSSLLPHSRILSIFNDEKNGISGSQLLNSRKLRVTVKNHLGKMIIYFEGDNFKSDPWIIERYDKFKPLSPTVIDDKMLPSERAVPIVVPHDVMKIWGGNQLCGFVFGPLQYTQSISYISHSQSFALGIGGNRALKLAITDEYISDIEAFLEVPGESKNQKELFTQDSQFYEEYEESEKGVPQIPKWKVGSFFYKDPLREYSPDGEGARDSCITVQKIYKTAKDDAQRRKHEFSVLFVLIAGNHFFSGDSTPITCPSSPFPRRKIVGLTAGYGEDKGWLLENCKTPILTSFRLFTAPSKTIRWDDGTSATSPYKGKPSSNSHMIDASGHVLSYSDSWSAENFSSIEHTASVRFLINKNLKYDVSGKLESLKDKAFYIEIWAGYEPLSEKSEYSKIKGFYKMFTGICYGGSIEESYGKKIMTCNIKDYSEILKGMRIINSPFFDGMRDVNAIYELMQMAGFRDTGGYDPGYFLKDMATRNTLLNQIEGAHLDGRYFLVEPYALPNSYRRLDQPYYRFDMGTPIYEAILKITKSSAKVFFFDQFGTACFEEYFDLMYRNFFEKFNLPVHFLFTSNPDKNTGQMIFNKVERSYTVEDVYNHIKIVSTSPERALLLMDQLNWESFDQPDSQGFLGYIKTFLQTEGMFGSEEAVKEISRMYKVMFKPAINCNFETYGLPIRSFDAIKVDNVLFRVMRVSHEIDPEKNRWWMNIQSERFEYDREDGGTAGA